MKDYTKYDFAAIVGAEVEIVLKDVKEPLVAKIIGYDLKTKQVYVIVIEPHPCFWLNGRPETLCCSDINSLTAKIKVEDMSVKQLKRLLRTYPAMGQEHIFVIAENGVHHSIMTTWEEVGKQDFTDYIDCTDWGWKHE